MRAALFGLGLACLGGVWFGPLPGLARGSFAAHMLMHMSVVAVAAPLLALGLRATRFDPVRGAPRVFAPLLASVGELIVVWAWHAPGLHHFSRHSLLGFALEQALFLASGLWLWLAAFGGDPSLRGDRSAQGGVALLLTSMHMTLLGALLALPPRPLYVHASHGVQAGLPGARDALEDQQLGGAIMLVAGGAAYLAGGLALTAELLRRVPKKRRCARCAG